MRVLARVPILLPLLVWACFASADPAGERQAGRQLLAQFKDALASKARRFIVPPGRYRLTPDRPESAHIHLRDVTDFELVGDHATLICETKNSAILLDHCRNVLIRGFTIDYDPLPLTQGTITAIAPDGTSLKFKVHAGYDPPAYDGKGVGHIWIVDPATRQVKTGSLAYGGPQELRRLDGGEYQLVHKAPRLHDTTQPGDWIKLPQRLNLRSPHAVRLSRCASVALANVTIHSAPCFGFVSSFGEAITLDAVHVVPGPPPPGATEPRIFSSSADGINLHGNTNGPVIRNCVVASTGDDGIAIYNFSDMVLVQESATTCLVGLREAAPGLLCYAPGDTLRFFRLQEGQTEERQIVSVLPAEAPPDLEAIKARALEAASPGAYTRAFRVTLDSAISLAAGDRILNCRYAGRDFEIAHNTVLDAASRGINANQSFGSVHDNVVRHTYLPGVHMTAFLKEGGSGFQTAVAIENNVVMDSCIGLPNRKDWQGGISIVNWDAECPFQDGHSRLTLRGNRISASHGPALRLHCASRLTIEQNVISPECSAAAVVLDSVTSANFSRNLIIPASAAVEIAANCRRIKADQEP